MKSAVFVDQLGLCIDADAAPPPTARSYRPPSWPPPRDWVCVEDREGNPISRWGDSIWQLWPWGQNKQLNFCDDLKNFVSEVHIDKHNADLFRMAITWRIWGFRGPKSIGTILNIHKSLKPVFAICSRNNILATELNRYPRVLEGLAGALSSSNYHQTITELDILLNANQFIGFKILDASGIAKLKSYQPAHESNQTEYIPPRIWQYQLERLDEFLDDFLLHKKNVEECFKYCADAYQRQGDAGCNVKGPFYGRFSETAEKFNIKGILEKWVINSDQRKIGIRSLSTYMSMASFVGMAYTLNLTLARRHEGFNLRFNCLKRHEDKAYGQILLVEGQTTKIIQDEDALWVASPSVERAINVMQSVALLRSEFIPKNMRQKNIFLINYALEPWSSSRPRKKFMGVKPTTPSYAESIERYPLLFEKKNILITEEDFKIALLVNPTLDLNTFKIGKPWSFSWHQLRRTGSVNMYSSGEISDATMQLQLKHLNPMTSLFYGRGNSALHLNENTRNIIVNAFYEVMGRQLNEINTNRFVSPFGETQKENLLSISAPNKSINLISKKDSALYEMAARNGEINFRRTAVGACMKNGQCNGDGFSAVSDCAGGDGAAPCANAIFDRNRASANKSRLEAVLNQIKITQRDTPRFRYLDQERKGLENYFAYLK